MEEKEQTAKEIAQELKENERLRKKGIFKSYWDLEQELNKFNLNRVLWDITELCKTEILDKPRTQEKANNLILEWWNNKKDKISISEFRLSYNCLYLLRKEYNKRKRNFKE